MIDHVFLIRNTEWSNRSFLPLFDDHLVFCQEVEDRFCGVCPLACYAHPMVRSERDINTYHKLCTLTVIKTGIVKLKEVLEDRGGCGSFDPRSDYMKTMNLISKLSRIPQKVSV
jgi:hypothetical protein